MELAIVDLARRMRDRHYEVLGQHGIWLPFDACNLETRRAWVAAAIVARPDLVEGTSVPPDSWLAGVLPVYTADEFRKQVLGEEPPPA